MIPRRRALLALFVLTLAGALSACGPSSSSDDKNDSDAGQGRVRAAVPVGQGFDFYILSLSWSPSYCEAGGSDANPEQCDAGRPYAFVVHGLWPQFERGYPSKCPTPAPNVAAGTMRSLFDIMPSGGLIRHEWREHGTCSGLGQADYFRVLRAAREQIFIPNEYRRLDAYRTVAPQDVENAFLNANPAMPADGVAVTCDRRFLREVRICMTRNLDFRSCPEIERQSCRRSTTVMPPVRGG